MSDPRPRRPWFQLHLSTALMLMFAGAGLSYLNVQPRYEERAIGSTTYRNQAYMNEVTIRYYGWPVVCCRHFEYSAREVPPGNYFDYWILAADVTVAMVLLMIVAVVCEIVWRVRARRAKN
jgi:hypothetical protein